MDDDPVFKQKYQKYKLRVKMWEKNFKKKHGRIPSKYDIREASQDIRDSYKMYYKLKTSFLEDTLNDVLAEDGFDVLEMSQTENDCATDATEQNITLDGSLCESVNGGPQLPLDISTIVGNAAPSSSNSAAFSNMQELPTAGALANIVNLHENHIIKQFEAVEQFVLNENAWGSNVSKHPVDETTITSNKGNAQRKSLKSNLNQKLFKSSSFSKRNPRKSLSRSALDSSLRGSQTNLTIGNGQEQREVLPDLETILMQKAKEQQAVASIVANPMLLGDKTKDSIKTHVDEGWLNRTAAQNGIKTSAVGKRIESNSNVTSYTPGKKQTYGLSNLDVSKFVMPKTEPLQATTKEEVEQIEVMEAEQSQLTIEKVDNNFVEMLTDTNVNKVKPRGKVDNDASDSSNSVVSDSENECEPQEFRHIVKRRRTMPTLDANQPQSKPTNREANITENENAIVNNNKKEPEAFHETDDEKHSANENNNTSGKDFSVDEDKDEDYVAEKPKRKKAVGKRVKSVKKEPKAKLVKTEPKPPKEKKTKVTKKQTAARSTRANPKNNSKVQLQDQEEPPEEQPLNPADLKYTLALENGDITSIPRVQLSELDAVDDVAQRYINTYAPMSSSTATAQRIPSAPINEKRDAARRKLEEKVASGKLNENFVTINIQKKTFVRGKKSVNFSKYKKKLWKNQKRIAALTGPEMDMGGCDGGVLTCFSCGQVGHFAQNCKVKGDALLPLTAQLEEDPSPFPTLEEAEHMASQSALAVHSRNIAKLPAASNSAIYRNDMLECNEENDEDDSDDGAADDASNDEEVLMETDDELEGMDIDEAAAVAETAEQNVSPIKQYVGHKIPAEFLKQAGLDDKETATAASKFGGVDPLYDLNADGSVRDVTPEVLEALHLFGHTHFRKGQDRAVMRILSGLSTLVTLSTGSGKSLCYQLPAYLYSRQKKSITLVISPLVSLMEDQVTGVPHFLRAHCLHTNQTPQQKQKILQLISDGEIDILLVSPEAVVAGERSTGFGSILRQLPPIAFACIDEAHCVSQWSHNFRPSYLMICKVLKKNLGVRNVLGLTATATLPTRLSIINHLGITDGERGIISDTPLPNNLILSASKDENRDGALLQLLNSKRFDECQSIIIYCTRRDECERIAGFIRTCMQDRKIDEPEGGKKKRKRINWHAEPYHAGMPSSRRRTIQNAFMKNELRIVVATIAFGMGINKPDIRAVLHYNMPRNFESYVQEIGRAGRDGKLSHCHLFLDAYGGDQNELRRHIYANSIDRHVIRKLLQRIFVPCSCDKNLNATNKHNNTDRAVEQRLVDASDFGSVHAASKKSRQHICPGHEIGFSIEQTVEALDIPEENISTLLCYMELDTRWGINVLSSAYIMAKVISYGGPKYLKHAAKECPPLAMAIALKIKNNSFKDDANIIEFSVVDIAAAIGWNSGVVKYQLKNLEWVQINGFSKRSPVNVSFYNLGFRIKAPGDFIAEEIDDALDTLYNRSVKQEKTQLIQLQYVFQGLSSVAYNSCAPCTSEHFSHDRSDQLKGIIRDYFRNDYPKDLKLEIDSTTVPDDYIISDVHGLINMYPDNNFSGRNIARIFHGISSPNYPAVMWGRCKYWRANSKVDFNRIVQLANVEIVKRRT